MASTMVPSPTDRNLRPPATFPVLISGPSDPTVIPWYQPQEIVIPTFPCPSFPYPSDSISITKMAVFMDLRNRGYWLSSGIKFGGDYVAYPGDPLRFHSHFIVSVITTSISMADLVAWGRLATGVKKSQLIAGASDTKETVFFTVNWGGF